MDTLILLSDECAELAAKLRRASELGADITIAELQREASNLAGSLMLFTGQNVDQCLLDVLAATVGSLQRSKAHGESCERKIAELMGAIFEAGIHYGEMALELEQLKRKNAELENDVAALNHANMGSL